MQCQIQYGCRSFTPPIREFELILLSWEKFGGKFREEEAGQKSLWRICEKRTRYQTPTDGPNRTKPAIGRARERNLTDSLTYLQARVGERRCKKGKVQKNKSPPLLVPRTPKIGYPLLELDEGSLLSRNSRYLEFFPGPLIRSHSC